MGRAVARQAVRLHVYKGSVFSGPFILPHICVWYSIAEASYACRFYGMEYIPDASNKHEFSRPALKKVILAAAHKREIPLLLWFDGKKLWVKQ